MNKPRQTEHAIILFDGICNLCNGVVQFIIRKDANDYFRFAPLQSEFAEKILKAKKPNSKPLKSIVLVKNGRIYEKSDAALRITKNLKGLWPINQLFLIIPRFIRDWVYDFIAQNRYKWFGQRKECMVPTPELKAKFLS